MRDVLSKFEIWTPSRRTSFAASPIDTETPEDSQRLKRRDVRASKQAFRARHAPSLKFGRLRKQQVLQLPIDTATPEESHRLKRRHQSLKTSISCEISFNFEQLFRKKLRLSTVTQHVHMSQSATPATRNEARRPMKQPNDACAAFPIGTELRRHDDYRRRQTTTRHAGGEHRSKPQTPKTVNRNPSLRIREKKWKYISLLL